MTHHDIFLQHMAKMLATAPAEIIADGQWHRFSTSSRSTDKAGWYVLHDDGDNAAGAFGCWRSGVTHTWSAKDTAAMTYEERRAHYKRMEAIKNQQLQARAAIHCAAAVKAREYLAAAQPQTQPHAYLVAKGLEAGSLTVLNGSLVIPMFGIDGSLQSLQFIAEDGSKRFLKGGKMRGSFCSIGEIDNAAVIVICEGYATGASVHQATNLPVAVAFNAGNLQPVAEAMRSKYPDAVLLLAADDDAYTPTGNTGMEAAKQAALMARGIVVKPIFSRREGKLTDFNDFTKPRDWKPWPTCLTRCWRCAMLDTVKNQEPNTTLANIPTASECPCFRAFKTPITDDAGALQFKAGVYYFEAPKDEDSKPSGVRISSYFELQSQTADIHGESAGVQILYAPTTAPKSFRTKVIPAGLISGDMRQLLALLRNSGIFISVGQERQVRNYLNSYERLPVITSLQQIGWAGRNGHSAYVLPDGILGTEAHRYIYSPRGHGADTGYATKGTLDDWKREVSAYAKGNDLLTLCICVALAAPLVRHTGSGGGGVHIFGDSSGGKSTCLHIACSVWGSRELKRSWKTSAKGIEGIAAAGNDCLIALDEIKQADPRKIGGMVFDLANGQATSRLDRTGEAKPTAKWCCTIFSNGERSINTTMDMAGEVTTAGQDVRMIDILASGKYGVWDELHHFANGAEFSDHMNHATTLHYGHAGRRFVELLINNDEPLEELVKAVTEYAQKMGIAANDDGQVKRAANRFALFALAGEMATDWQLTGWEAGEATQAMQRLFAGWKAERGDTSRSKEQSQVIEALKAFLEAHGNSRFEKVQGLGLTVHSEPPNQVIYEQAGYVRGSEYLLTSSGLKAAVKGFEPRRIISNLVQHSLLTRNPDTSEAAVKFNVNGKAIKLYSIKFNQLQEV